MPILCLTYALQYYDKVILGHAAVFGLRAHMDLESGLRWVDGRVIQAFDTYMR